MKTVREGAIEISMRVKSGSYLNITLNNWLLENELNHLDTRLLTRLVYSIEQHRLYLDFGMKQALGEVKLKNFEYHVLLSAYCQMLYFDAIPDYAIINESVDIVKHKRGQKVAGFMNACLRKLANHRDIDLSSLTNEDDYLSIYYSHPLWIVKMLKKQYGKDALIEILKSDNEIPGLCGVVNELKTTREQLIAKHPSLIPGKLSKHVVYFEEGNIAHSDLFKNGIVSVQDEGASVIVDELCLEDHLNVLDMCAAPGTKTCQIAMQMHDTGTIHCYDLHESRVHLIEQNLKRLGITSVQAMAYDATLLTQKEPLESFDRILLDGPCSGLGVLGRKPEIRYHDSSALDACQQLQFTLLETAVKLLKKGGILVYSTCTLNKKENEKNVQQFLNQHPECRLIQERTILPYEYHTDGFYMARLEKL